MWPYWLLFCMPCLAALATRANNTARINGVRKQRFSASWLLCLLLLTFMIGWRYRVGGDWGAYFGYLEEAAGTEFWILLGRPDPAYRLLNYVSNQLGIGIIGVNAISGLLFSFGLIRFCRSLPRPWLALSISIPYMVIVVGMGYSRQGIALGFAMAALVSLGGRSASGFIFWILIGGLFHKTALILLPIAALASAQNRILMGLIVLSMIGVIYQFALGDEADRLIQNYYTDGYQSSGALIRLSMNVLPAAIFLIWRKKFFLSFSERRLWQLMAVGAGAMFLAYFFTSASTALDRVALYLLPLQLFVFSHLPDVFGGYGKRNQGLVFFILLYYALVLFVWLNFGNFSRAWVPYTLYL